MNWISLDEEREGWRLFRRSVISPVIIWMFILFIMFSIAYFPDINIFESIISFIPFFINFKLGIIATFGSLILTLYINVRSETKNAWNNPQEYQYSFAYQWYARLIAWFLGIVWFCNFIYGVWRYIKIPEDTKRLFLAKVWDDENHGKFIGNDVVFDMNIPLWVFLFLSWFILSFSTYMSNRNIPIHHTIMAAFTEIKVLYQRGQGLPVRYNKSAIKIIEYIYDNDIDPNDTIPESSKGSWDKIYQIFPKNSAKGYHYLVNGMRPFRRKIILKISVVYVFAIIVHVLSSIYILENIYHINLSIRLEHILLVLIVSIFFGAIAIAIFINPFLDIINILIIHYKAIWIWCIVFFLGMFILMVIYCGFLFNLLSILYAYQGGESEDNSGSLFQVLVTLTVVLVVFLSVCQIAILLNHIDYMDEDHEKILLETVLEKGREEIDQILPIGINGFMISRIIYLHVRSRKIYLSYLRSNGKDEELLEDDLADAYKKSGEDRTKFPKLSNMYDIFS